jgi:hypothetical protein
VLSASSVGVTSGERPLVGPPLGPADSGTGGIRRGTSGIRRSARRVGTRGGVGSTPEDETGGGRRSGSRVGRATVGEADEFGTSNNESIEGVGPDVGPLEAGVHSREAGEIAGGWLVGASVLHVDLTMEEISLSHRNTD